MTNSGVVLDSDCLTIGGLEGGVVLDCETLDGGVLLVTGCSSPSVGGPLIATLRKCSIVNSTIISAAY